MRRHELLSGRGSGVTLKDRKLDGLWIYGVGRGEPWDLCDTGLIAYSPVSYVSSIFILREWKIEMESTSEWGDSVLLAVFRLYFNSPKDSAWHDTLLIWYVCFISPCMAEVRFELFAWWESVGKSWLPSSISCSSGSRDNGSWKEMRLEPWRVRAEWNTWMNHRASRAKYLWSVAAVFRIALFEIDPTLER